MSLCLVPPSIKLHFPSVGTDAISGNYSETSISSTAWGVSSSDEITETNSSSSSQTTTDDLAPTNITFTASDFITDHQPPSISETPPVPAYDIVTGSHKFRFERYSRREGFEVGEYLTSDTFEVGGYEWAITLYPNGKKEESNSYISLYIRLKSEQGDVNALFELTLVDQSGKGKHKIHTLFRRDQETQPRLMRNRGSQWGFPRYLNKKYLEYSGYLKDDCLLVSCLVGVLVSDKEKIIPGPVSLISNCLSPPVGDQITQFMEVQGMKRSNCEDTELSHLRLASKVIIAFGSPLQLQGLINDGDRCKFDQYMCAVDDILPSFKSGMVLSYETQGIYAMKTLQLVFRGILDSSISMIKSDGLSSTAYSSTVTSNYSYELQGGNHIGHGELSSDQIYRLRSIIERLNSAGYLEDCIEVYRISRKSAVDARFLRFGIGKWSINDFRCLDKEESSAKIKLWIGAAHNCYLSLFPRERQNYEKIFYGVGAVTFDNCFLAIVKHVAIELNSFAEAVSTTPVSFQKLFDILDLYKSLLVILPEIENTFQSVSSADISRQAAKTIDRLTTLIRKLFFSFEDTVLNEKLNTPLPNGVVHSLTKYAMDYVASISLYKELLTDVILSTPTNILGNIRDEKFLEASCGTPLGLHMIWIMISLKFNLVGKSAFYGDSSLRYIFIINNVNYMVKSIKGSPELLEMIGKDYLSMLSKDVLEAEEEYVSSTWSRLLYCLRDDGLNHKFPFYSGISKNALKDRFKTFNTTFEEICRTQSTRFMPDIKLRGQLHNLILHKLLQAYKSFLEKFSSHMEGERYKERYIKYSPDDLESKVQNLFSEH